MQLSDCQCWHGAMQWAIQRSLFTAPLTGKQGFLSRIGIVSGAPLTLAPQNDGVVNNTGVSTRVLLDVQKFLAIRPDFTGDEIGIQKVVCGIGFSARCNLMFKTNAKLRPAIGELYTALVCQTRRMSLDLSTFLGRGQQVLACVNAASPAVLLEVA